MEENININKKVTVGRVRLNGLIKKIINKTPKNIFGLFFVFTLIILGSLMFTNRASAATTYYVSVADGNDGNTGLSSTPGASGPWKTTTKVNGASFNPGDQILFKSGETWSSSYIAPPSSGSVGSPITFSSYSTGVAPIITNQYGYALNITSKSYITISNLDLRNTNVDAWAQAFILTGTSDHIILDNLKLNAQGYGFVSDTSVSDITLNQINLGSSITNQGIYFYGAANARITVSNVTAAVTTQGNYTVQILNTADISVSQIAGSVEIGGSSGLITVSDVTVTPTNNGGLYILNTVASAGSYINRVSVTSSLYSGLTFDGAANFTINDCTSSLAHSDGLRIINTSYNLTFNHCVVSGAFGDGFTIYDNGSHDITFNYSVAHGNGNPASISEGDGFTAHGSNYNIFINYPISYGNTCSGFALVGTGSGNLYNATAYANGGDFSGSGGVTQVRGNYYFSLAGNNSTTGTTWIVKNNIGMNGFPREIDYAGGTAPVADYNLYYPTDPTKLASIDGTTNLTWATYHATHETNSLNSDPKFTNTASNNFTLLSTSPAIDHGVSLGSTYKLGLNPNSVWPSAVNTLDQTLNGSGWEMGAYVYSNPLSSTKAITAFNFSALSPAVTGVVTEGSHTIALTIPFGTAVTALVPTITITGSSVSPNTGVAHDFTTPQTYTVTAADNSTQAYVVTVTVAANTAKAITAFNFSALSPAVTGVVTEGSHTIALTVPFGTAVTALVPTITITGSSVSPNTGVAHDFTTPQTYTVTAADASTQIYAVTVNVAAQVTYTLSITSTNGSVAKSPDQASYDSGSSVTLTATANSGYSFSSWSGDASGSTNPLTVIMNGDKSIIANFTADTPTHSSSGGSYIVTPPPITEPSDLEKTLAMIEKYKAQQNNSPVTLLPIIRILKLVTPKMWGDDVLALQTYLNTKGYNSGTPDGNFGPKTQTAVVAFQKANGLVPDGSVGPNTLKYLNGDQTTTTTSPIIQPTVTRILKLLVPRMIGDDVKSLQTYLSTNGYDVGTPDGIFGTKTQSAVIAFQTANKLTPDGIVGPLTRGEMNK